MNHWKNPGGSSPLPCPLLVVTAAVVVEDYGRGEGEIFVGREPGVDLAHYPSQINPGLNDGTPWGSQNEIARSYQHPAAGGLLRNIKNKG